MFDYIEGYDEAGNAIWYTDTHPFEDPIGWIDSNGVKHLYGEDSTESK